MFKNMLSHGLLANQCIYKMYIVQTLMKLMSPFVTVMYISVTYRNPELGNNPFSTHTIDCLTHHQAFDKPTGQHWYTLIFKPQQPTQDSNPIPSHHDLCFAFLIYFIPLAMRKFSQILTFM